MQDAFEPARRVSMQDPNFARSVVLLCDYNPDGAFGLVVNRPTEMAAGSMVRLEPAVVSSNGLPLCIGGPVEPERGWILLAEAPSEPDYRTICEGLYLSTSPELLRRVLTENPPPRARVLAGYAGWGSGQLDAELAQSAWLIGALDVDLLFDVEPEAMWETAIRRMGADPAALHLGQGIH
jgi:putative transcriptional regulator